MSNKLAYTIESFMCTDSAAPYYVPGPRTSDPKIWSSRISSPHPLGERNSQPLTVD